MRNKILFQKPAVHKRMRRLIILINLMILVVMMIFMAFIHTDSVYARYMLHDQISLSVIIPSDGN